MNPETTFLSANLCRLGHAPTYRYKANRACVKCSSMQVAEWTGANSQRSREINKKWKDKNRVKIRTACRERGWRLAGLPTPTRPAPDVCECCGGPPNGQGALHLDHCHESGKFRGWLCSNCNRGIGYLGDSLDGIVRAASYLKRAAIGGMDA